MQPSKSVQPERDSVVDSVDSIALAAIEEGPIAGLSIAIVRDGELLVSEGYGLANVQTAVPASADTLYDIASVTKLFTAAAIMQLVESGRVRLEDTLAALLPVFPNKEQGQRITVRHLLTHTSGLSDYEAADTERWLEKGTALSADFVLDFLRDRPLEFQPGTRWAYSNSGYYLLALVIERAARRKYGEYVREEIAEPLGLSQTALCDETAASRHVARGYEPGNGSLVASKLYIPRNIIGDGGLCSTVGDLVKLPGAFRRGTVLRDAAVTQMRTPTVLSDGTSVDYGFGVRRGVLDGHELWGHTGGMSTYWAALIDYPQDNVTIAVLVNTDGASEDALTIEGRVARIVLGLAEPVLKDLPLSQREIHAFSGRYTDGANEIRVFPREERLLRAIQDSERPPLRLLYQGENTFGWSAYPMDRAVLHVRDGRAFGYSQYYNGVFASYFAVQ